MRTRYFRHPFRDQCCGSTLTSPPFYENLSGLTIRVSTATQRLEALRNRTRFQEHQLGRTPKTSDSTVEWYNDLFRLRDERVSFPVEDFASSANVLQHVRQVPVRFSVGFPVKMSEEENWGKFLKLLNLHVDRGVSEDGILVFGNADAQEDWGPLSGTTNG